MLPAASEGVVHVELTEPPFQATLSTHNHADFARLAHGLRFRARATAGVAVRASLKTTLDSDYFAARDAGNLWPVALVSVGTDWQSFEVPVTDMLPTESPEAPPQGDRPAFTVAFVIEASMGPAELWVDDVGFF